MGAVGKSPGTVPEQPVGIEDEQSCLLDVQSRGQTERAGLRHGQTRSPQQTGLELRGLV